LLFLYSEISMKYFLEEFSKNSKKVLCSQIDESLLNQSLVVAGWVQNQRDHGHFAFLDLKDHTGVLQIFLNLEVLKKFKISLHSVLAVKGTLLKRPEGAENKKLKTGLFELKVEEVHVLSSSDVLPVDPEDEKVRDSLKLKYRYLFLRSQKLKKNLKLRDEIVNTVRQTLRKEGFVEYETPILYKTTPEGARDYLVPSRIHPGHFYSLVQSPQILKQLLIIGGVWKYFQMARCFRDEDLRSDRQPEFTQIDLEMSFVDIADVLKLNEKIIRALWKNVEIEKLSYQESMEYYGSDQPDLRVPLKLKALEDVEDLGIEIFNKTLKNKGRIKSLALPPSECWNRSALDKLTREVKNLGGRGLIYIKDEGGKLNSSLSFSQDVLKKLYQKAHGIPKGLVFIIAGEESLVNTCFAFLISYTAQKISLMDSSKDKFIWITNFPLFALEEGNVVSMHHPFTMPDDKGLSPLDVIERLKNSVGNLNEISQWTSKAYDLVCNGQEVAGGSIRIHNPEIQNFIFKILGVSDQKIQDQFGFFIEALRYGTPPHGGIAWGLDRLVMILSGADDIRDVISFPKTLQATCLMSQAPSMVEEARLRELGLSLKERLK